MDNAMPGCGCRDAGATERRSDGATGRRGDGATGRRGEGAKGRRGDGLCEKTRSPGVCWVLRKIKKNNNTKRFSLCRLYKLRSEQKIQTAEVKVKRMQGVE